jgi:hypothetical protein
MNRMSREAQSTLHVINSVRRGLTRQDRKNSGRQRDRVATQDEFHHAISKPDRCHAALDHVGRKLSTHKHVDLNDSHSKQTRPDQPGHASDAGMRAVPKPAQSPASTPQRWNLNQDLQNSTNDHTNG